MPAHQAFIAALRGLLDPMASFPGLLPSAPDAFDEDALLITGFGSGAMDLWTMDLAVDPMVAQARQVAIVHPGIAAQEPSGERQPVRQEPPPPEQAPPPSPTEACAAPPGAPSGPSPGLPPLPVANDHVPPMLPAAGDTAAQTSSPDAATTPAPPAPPGEAVGLNSGTATDPIERIGAPPAQAGEVSEPRQDSTVATPPPEVGPVVASGDSDPGHSIAPDAPPLRQEAPAFAAEFSPFFDPSVTTAMHLAANLPADASLTDHFLVVTSIFDSLGLRHFMMLSFSKNPESFGANPWCMTLLASGDAGSGTSPAAVTLTFNDGAIAAITGGGTDRWGTWIAPPINFALVPGGAGTDAAFSFDADFGHGPQTILLSLGSFAQAFGGVTDVAGPTSFGGTAIFTVQDLSQNGACFGTYYGLSLNPQGDVTVQYNNGQSQVIAAGASWPAPRLDPGLGPVATTQLSLQANLPADTLSTDDFLIQTLIHDQLGAAHRMTLHLHQNPAASGIGPWTMTLSLADDAHSATQPVAVMLAFNDGTIPGQPAGTIAAITGGGTDAHGIADPAPSHFTLLPGPTGSAAAFSFEADFGHGTQTIAVSLGSFNQAAGGVTEFAGVIGSRGEAQLSLGAIIQNGRAADGEAAPPGWPVINLAPNHDHPGLRADSGAAAFSGLSAADPGSLWQLMLADPTEGSMPLAPITSLPPEAYAFQ